MTAKDIRQKFLDFWKEKPRIHEQIPSSPLLPENDPTTLFTSCGMQPLIPYLLGEKHPLGKRLVNSQKSFRSQDIEEVGDNRHTTFFEMLGNWSMGDYFKKEQLPWFFEFLTKDLQIDPKKLYVSVFAGNKDVPKDEESVKIWKNIFKTVGIEAKEEERIFAYGVEKNWWSRSGIPANMPGGEPGGPDSEVFYDFGEEFHLHENSVYKNGKCHPNCDCGRFLEIGNSVFMEYQKQTDGTFKKLPQQNVDFGGGLERLTAVCNGQQDVFQTDLFIPIIEVLEQASKKTYQGNEHSMRVIADHLKAATFMLSEGLVPGNKQQSYILRRLIRRSVVKMHQLGIGQTKTQVAKEVCQAIADIYGDYYEDLKKHFQNISNILTTEVNKFEKSLSKGIKMIENLDKIDGKIAFDFYQSYGFPLEITSEIALQKGLKIDIEEFKKEFTKHQDLSRNTSKGMFKGGLADNSEIITKLHTATHLLQQALRTILGEKIRQKGSNITQERLRFDFSHPQKVSESELKEVENLVNQKIAQNLAVTMKILDLNEAKNQNALFVEGANYPQKVKVYSILGFSREICGGPHAGFTGELGLFKIIKEEGVSANVRRIYATLL